MPPLSTALLIAIAVAGLAACSLAGTRWGGSLAEEGSLPEAMAYDPAGAGK